MNLKFLFFLSATVVFRISAAPTPLSIVKKDVDSSLVPDFGHEAGINPDSTRSNCDGIKNDKGEVVRRIPCSCPPPRDKFIAALNANVDAGFAIHNPDVNVSFPAGDNKDSKFKRMMAAIVTLQNLDGPGKGCPASSTTYSAQLKAVIEGTDSPPSSSPPSPVPSLSDTLPFSVPPSPSPSVPIRPPQPSSSEVVDRNLIPEFGHESGQNPTGTGDCDGIKNAVGQAIKVPCSCPPDREFFIEASSSSASLVHRFIIPFLLLNQSLIANVAAGHVVNNPTVNVSFPSGDDKPSKLSRMHAATVTLQNFNGTGRGCPASSTTFNAQLKSIQDS